jgi:hypothetical protein
MRTSAYPYLFQRHRFAWKVISCVWGDSRPLAFFRKDEREAWEEGREGIGGGFEGYTDCGDGFWIRNRLVWEFLDVCKYFGLGLMMCCGVRSMWMSGCVSTARESHCTSTNRQKIHRSLRKGSWGLEHRLADDVAVGVLEILGALAWPIQANAP